MPYVPLPDVGSANVPVWICLFIILFLNRLDRTILVLMRQPIFMFFYTLNYVSHVLFGVLFVSIVREFQLIQYIECQSHDHTNDTSQYHTCQLNAAYLYGDT